MIFTNKLKLNKEKRRIVLSAVKIFVFILTFLGLSSIILLQKLQLKSKQNHIDVLLQDKQDIICESERVIDSLNLINNNVMNSVKQRVTATMYYPVVA